AARHGKRVPMLVKIAPDLSDDDIDACGRVLSDLQVDGVIATNTTVDRLSIEGHPLAGEPGGLSGAPLYGKSTAVLRRLRSRLDAAIPMIGVGGRSEEHTSELQSRENLVCRLLLEKTNTP